MQANHEQLMLRDLGDPGWGDPWFPHGAVLLPLPACMALCVSVFFPFLVMFAAIP